MNLKILPLFLFINSIQGLDVQVAKCCPDPQVLDPESDTCILLEGWQDRGDAQVVGQVTGIDLTKPASEREVELNLVTDGLDSIFHQPECSSWQAEYTEIGTENGTAWLTQNGHLVLEDGQHQFLYHEFCVDKTTQGKLVAQTCPTCTQEQPCLPLCCPHGQAWVLDPQSDEEVCGDQTNGGDFNEAYWEEQELQMEEWQQRHKFIFRAPKIPQGFKCPEGQQMDVVHSYPGFPDIVDKFEVGADSRLYGWNISFTDEFGAAAKALNVSWEEGEFCATFVDQEYEKNNPDGVFHLTYLTCGDITEQDPDLWNSDIRHEEADINGSSVENSPQILIPILVFMALR